MKAVFFINICGMYFIQVAVPCLPCQETCGIDKQYCDPTCKLNNFQAFSFTLTGLNLEPIAKNNQLGSIQFHPEPVGNVTTNEVNVTSTVDNTPQDNTTTTVAAPYFLIVKAVTGNQTILPLFCL